MGVSVCVCVCAPSPSLHVPTLPSVALNGMKVQWLPEWLGSVARGKKASDCTGANEKTSEFLTGCR